jgi:hypothetical protein
MLAAGAQAFAAVTEGGAAALWSRGTAAEGGVLVGCRVAVGVCGASGVPPTGVTMGKTCDW